MSRISRTIVALGYLLVLAILLIDAALVYASLMTITRNNRQVDRAREVIAELERTLSLLKDAERGQRGYLLTGREDYLRPYQAAVSGLDTGLGRVLSLSAEE